MSESFFSQCLTELYSTHIKLQKDEVLFKQGDAVDNIYFIKTGRLKLIRNTIDGSSVILHSGKSGETIAEASLFSTYYHCSAVTHLPSHVSFVKKKDILLVLQKRPQEMMQLLRLFSRQIQYLRSISEIKNIRSAQQRILNYLIINMDDTRKVKLDTPLKEIAQEIGLAHETFYRELKKLEIAGKILRTTSTITLT